MQWWKNKQLRPALWFLSGLLLVALARDILANGRPLYCRIEGESYFPGLRSLWTEARMPYRHRVLDSLEQNFLWRRFAYEAAVFAPVPFTPGEIPQASGDMVRNARPGTPLPGANKFRHWLGTDEDGHDVAAGLIGGARIAILTGAIAMSLAFGIGLLLGAVAGYWGDNRLRVRRGPLWLLLACLPLAWFYGTVVYHWVSPSVSGWISWALSILAFLALPFLFYQAGKLLCRWTYFDQTVFFPADLIIMRLAEVFTSLPALLVVIAFAAMLKAQTQTLWPMIAFIGAFSWTSIARFVRAELLRVRELDYVTAARAMGLNEWRILSRHALPNALRPAYTAFAFGVATAILLEASLSFLGYGDTNLQGATWGSLLQNARSYPELWWISLPPGLAIGLTILSLNAIGEALSERR